jgi:predicted nucleic acid-binding protein
VRRLVVPDASIIVKWALPSAGERAAEKALAVLAEWQAGTIDLLAPSLWRYEVANVLARKAANGAIALLGALLELEVPTVDPDHQLLVDALAITARRPGVTVYDAAYHALALRVGGVFLTADERYFRQTKRLGAIELLSS